MESVTGGRFHPNFNRIGGVKPAAGSGSTQRKVVQDLPKGFLADTRTSMDEVLHAADQLEDLIAGNEIILARTKKIGVLPPEVAATMATSRPAHWISSPALEITRTPVTPGCFSAGRLRRRRKDWDAR